LKFSGYYELNSSKKKVWENLNNIDVLKKCIDGCEEFLYIDKNKYNAKIFIKLGPVNASFRSTIEINNIIEEESYEIIAQGNAGQLGNASGKVIIFLKELDKKTILNYEADTRINGRIAQLGSRLIDGSVKKNTDVFFQNFSKILNEDSSIILNDKINNTIIKRVKFLTCLILLFLIILFIGLYVR
jgi:carbon monoxide dehydrogenase subunit G